MLDAILLPQIAGAWLTPSSRRPSLPALTSLPLSLLNPTPNRTPPKLSGLLINELLIRDEEEAIEGRWIQGCSSSWGNYFFAKAAFDEGFSTYIFIFYRQVAASILLVPLAIFFKRKTAPPLSLSVLIKFFVLALLGLTLVMNMYYLGLSYTSPVVLSAAANSIPVITFFWALLLRMETLNMKSPSGKAKVIGVALCFSGVITLCFYIGPHLNSVNHHPFFHQNKTIPIHHSNATWIVGTLLVVVANMLFSLWIVLQGMLLREYPSKLLLITYQTIFCTVQSFFMALAFQRDISRWKLSFNVSLLAIVYCGFCITGLTYYLQTWVIEKKGPVFVSMFRPLSLLFTVVVSYFLLGDVTHLGRGFRSWNLRSIRSLFG